ncbi:hypothetical protein, partial [Mesomycoplasma ovipneumoniae]
NAEDPKNYKEVGDVIYNIDPSKTWNPFPNYFNLDWDQIGPAEPVAEQTPESGKSQSTITLKAFAVFDHPDFTNGKTSRARQEITEAFIDTYIKK